MISRLLLKIPDSQWRIPRFLIGAKTISLNLVKCIGGMGGGRERSNSLSFSCSFRQKSCQITGFHPQTQWSPPTLLHPSAPIWETLDPPVEYPETVSDKIENDFGCVTLNAASRCTPRLITDSKMTQVFVARLHVSPCCRRG